MFKKQLQSITGKLQFAACCVRPGRVFVNRHYDVIAVMDDNVKYAVTQEVKKDLNWWRVFMEKYNGTSIMWLQQRLQLNQVFHTDACLTGAGRFCNGNYYHKQFTKWVFTWDDNVHIAHLEMLVIIIGLKL